MALVTVVIPNYQGIKFIEGCLSSLLSQEEGTPSFEVLVVDNASDDGSAEVIAEKFPEVRLICLEENTGFCHAVNVGIQNSESPYVLLLNNDTKVAPDFVKSLWLAILEGEGDPEHKVFAVSAAMLTWDKPEILDGAGDIYTIFGWALARGKGKPYAQYEKRERVFSACGGAAIYRREVFDEIGLFDENHFAYLEDLDLGWRANLRGYLNLYEPKARVLHYGSASTGTRYNAWKTRRAAANSIYVISKNLPLLLKVLHFPFLLAGFVIKQIFFVRKRLGKAYFQGIMDGLRLSFSEEGRKRKLRFQKKHIQDYLRVEGELLTGIFRR